MAIPQNVTDDLTALDAAITTQQQGQATLSQANTALTNAQSALTAAQQADQANQAATQAAEQKLDTDVAAWVAGNPTPAPTSTDPRLHPKLKASLKRLGR